MVSHNKRIVAALAAVAAMGIGLAGCGGSDTAGDTKSGSDGGVVNITYMHRLPDSEGMTLVNDIVAKWNKEHPNIQVKATKFDGNAADMIKKLETDVKAGNAPDLAQVGYAEVPEVFTKGLLQDVTDEAAKYKDDFASGPFALMQVDGKTYGLPQDTGPGQDRVCGIGYDPAYHGDGRADGGTRHAKREAVRRGGKGPGEG